MQNFRSKTGTVIELRFFMKKMKKMKKNDEEDEKEEDEESVKIIFTSISYLM